jgi:hypothetical protein
LTCTVVEKTRWGCYGNGRVTHFAETEHETNRCPRRHLLDNPELSELYTLRRRYGERLNDFEAENRFTTAALEGLDTIDSAVSWRTEDEIRQAHPPK